MKQQKKAYENQGQIKEKIFIAAQKLFVLKGYHNTNMPDIVKEAGVSTGAIYHYFSGKEDLARYIHKIALEEFLDKFDLQVRTKQTSPKKIHAFTRLMFEWVETDAIMVQYLLHARPKEVLETCVSICAKEGLDSVMEIVESGHRNGEIGTENIFVTAGVISGTITRLIQMRIDGIISTPLTELVDETAKRIWLGVKK